VESERDLREIETDIASSDSCGAQKSLVESVLSSGPGGVLESGNVAAEAASALASYLADGNNCGATILFAKAGDAIVGLYVGADVSSHSAATIVESLR
jgi:hypothetical protein